MSDSVKRLKIVVVGGVAGGASAAARARRVNAQAEIVMYEKGPVVSFANCGLPYHLGGEIQDRNKLLVASPKLFWDRFRIDVKTHHEIKRIDRTMKIVEGIMLENGEHFFASYDRLILATGAEPIRPPFCDPPAENLFHLWTLDDMDRILAYLHRNPIYKVVVIGAGFVGLEVVEQLHRLGIHVELIQNNDQILAPLDKIFARIIEQHLKEKNVRLHLSANIDETLREGSKIVGVRLASGTIIDAHMVIVGVGVRPRIQLAADAGLAIGKNGGVTVNEFLQTEDPNIYAAGDMVEYHHGVLHESIRVPLAGPANRAGRIAGEHAATGDSDRMGPVLGTSIVRVFDLTAASTGMNEKQLRGRRIPHRSVIIQASNHAGYFPGAQLMHLKIVYTPDDGKLLGAQAVGGEGVDKRIDVIASAIHFGGTVRDLSQLDLAYAPPFGSAKDPIHMAAFTAINDLESKPSCVPPDFDLSELQVVDVRSAKEREQLPLPNSIAIPIDELIDRWHELDPNKSTVTVCHSGKRAHIAACWLRGQGFYQVRNLTGGMSIRSQT